MEKEKMKETTKVDKDYFEEEVEYFIPRTKDDEEDVNVICNGIAIKVPVGKHVRIKRKYALILDSKRDESGIAADRRRALSDDN